MHVQQILLVIIFAAVLTISIYHFFLSVFIHRRIDRYFYFSISTLGGSMFALGAFLLSYPDAPERLLLFYRMRMLSLMVCVAAWFYCIYDIYFHNSLVPRVSLALSMVFAATVPFNGFVALPLGTLTVDFIGTTFQYRLPTTGIFYSLYAAFLLGFFMYSIVRIALCRNPVTSKVYGFIAFLPGAIGGMNDFAVTHGAIQNIMISEYLVFLFLMSVFVLFLRDEQKGYQRLQRLNVHLEDEVHKRTRELTDSNKQLTRSVEEHGRSEKALRKAEGRLRLLFETANDAIIICNIQGVIISWNRFARETFGYADQEIVGQHITCLVPERDREAHVRGQERFSQQQELFIPKKPVEASWLRRDGKEVPMEVTFTIWEEADERFFTLIARDITARRQSQANLRKAKEELETVISSSLDPIVVTDASGIITKVNRALLDMLGYAEEELMGMPMLRLLVVRDGVYESTAGEKVAIDELFRQQNKSNQERLLAEGKLLHWRSYILHKAGTIIPTIQNAVCLYDEQGRLAGTFGILRDITEERKAERELVTSKRLLENIIETSLDPMILGDGLGNLVKPNRAFLNMTGYAEEELVGKSSYDLAILKEGTYECTTGETILIDDAFLAEQKAKVAEIFREGKISNWMTYYRNKEHKIIPVVRNIVVQYNEDHEAIAAFAVIRDITDQIRTQRELINAKEAAEQANQSKGAFLASVSHEIRTPMNAIIGFTDMLFDSKLDHEQHDYATMIKRSGESLLSLINDILDFSKIEAGRMDVQEIGFDIEMLAYDICELMRPRIAGKGIEIICRIDDDLPAQVQGDPYRFRQVLVNLVGNAAKFTESGEIELALELAEEKDDRMLVHTRVRDTGIGIPPDRLETVFELFQQADSSITRKYGGTGLGLSISRRIAGLLGGHCWAESREAPGSTFHFTAWLRHADVREVRRIAPVSLADKRVLITDDNSTSLAILQRVLESARMRVTSRADGGEALLALQQAQAADEMFDLAIIDIRMPDMSGYELAQKVRAQYGPALPLLAFTAAMDGSEKQCHTFGFNGFLPKPIPPLKLFKMLELLLGAATAGEQGPDVERKIVTQHSMREDAKSSVSILLAEDNPVNQKLATTLLTKAGYRVEVASSGRYAVNMFTAAPQRYDIILMDIQMPEMSGIEATAAIRQQGFADIPIIAMTANAMVGDREMCLQAGMNDYIAKPIKRDVVFDVIKKWVIEGRSPLLAN